MQENTRKGMQLVKCMNHDPENSKWGEYAPEGGCQEKMYIDERASKGLCWQCTSRSVSHIKGESYARSTEN